VAQNQAGNFSNGINGSLEVPYASSLMSPAELTVEAWVTYDGSTLGPLNRFPTIIRGNIVTGWSYFLRVNAGSTNQRQLRWAVRTQNSGVVMVNWNFSPGDLQCWTHIAATYDGLTSRMFVNGVEVGQAAGGGPIVDNGGVIGIGEGRRDPIYHNEVWNGQLDEVRSWSIALTSSQIRNLMFAPVSFLVNLEAAWPLDGTTIDASGNGHGATTFGAITFVPATIPTQFLYQTNSAEAALDINGANGTSFCAGDTTILAGQTANLNFASTLIGAPFDIAASVGQGLVAAGAGGYSTVGGQLINLDLSAPSLFFLNGGSLSNPFGGVFGANGSIPVTSATPLTAAGQMIILNPGQSDGFSISAGAGLVVQ